MINIFFLYSCFLRRHWNDKLNKTTYTQCHTYYEKKKSKPSGKKSKQICLKIPSETKTHIMNVQQIHHNPCNTDNTDGYCDGSQQKSSAHANHIQTDEQHTQQRRQSVTTLTTSTSESASSIRDTQTKTTNTTTTTLSSSSPTIQSPKSRMSMFFFRLHNLQREQENKRKKSVQQQRQRQRRGAKVFRSDSDTFGHLTLAPSRLFEKTPIKPSDSLDEIALQIPRYLYSNSTSPSPHTTEWKTVANI